MASDERVELRGMVLEGRYRIGASVGMGGTGVVFEATRLVDRAAVVLKTLRPTYAHNPEIVRRMRREARVARATFHPGIVPVTDEGVLPDGSPYMVMDRAFGESLSQLMRRSGKLGGAEVAAIATRVAAVLHAVHRQGYVHRDIKPEHVLLDRTPEGELKVQILDFGVCAAGDAPREEREAERGRVYGTPSYVSPEQASGDPDVDGRADVWGLGVVMFEALTGRLPFRGRDVTSLLRRIIAEDAPRAGLLAHHVSWELDEVVARAMARNREARFAGMRALARALAPHVGRRVVTERRLAERLVVGRDRAELLPTARPAVAAA